jgi:methyl-accepting chemotaxis protein
MDYDEIEIINKNPILNKLEFSQKEYILENSSFVSLEQGQNIFLEGDDTDNVYIIASGVISISINDVDEGQKQIAELITGDIFGEHSLILTEDTARRNASAYSLINVNLLEIPKDIFLKVSKTDNHIYNELKENSLKLLFKRIEESEFINLLNEISFHDYDFQSPVYKDGSLIFKEGDFSDAAYIVLSGRVKIAKNEGEIQVLARLKSGQMFGEMGLEKGKGRAASAIAEGNVTLLKINSSDFFRLARESKGLESFISKTTGGYSDQILNKNNKTISIQKLPIYISFVAILSLLALSLFSINYSKNFTIKNYKDSSYSIIENQANGLNKYFETIIINVKVMSESAVVKESIRNFTNAFNKLDNPKDELQKHYITNNPYPLGEKEKLLHSDMGLLYDEIHAKYHKTFKNFNNLNGYYDTFLINKNGDIVYSNFKENDFASNVINGRYQNSGIAKVFNKIKTTNKISSTDFEKYEPSYFAPASFIGAPIMENGKFIGAFVIQMPIEKINGFLSNYTSPEKTAETFLTANDGFLRSLPYGETENEIILNQRTPLLQSLHRNEDSDFYLDRDGNKVIAKKVDIDFLDNDWCLVYKIDKDEIFTSIDKMIFVLIGMSVVIGLMSLIIFFRFSKLIVQPIKNIKSAMDKVSSGQRGVAIPHISESNEIGEIAKSLNDFQKKLENGEKLASQQLREQQIKIEKQNYVSKKIEDFKLDFTDTINAVNNSIATVTQISEKILVGTENSSESITVIQEDSSDASHSVSQVADSTEEMSNSISEIEERARKSEKSIKDAVEESEYLNSQVEELTSVANSIGEVITLINEIAEQTNLLALNATIEAARAGESGKGFAVVASEVKNLASQTADATHEISQKITNVQNATTEAGKYIGSINGMISSLENELNLIFNALKTQNESADDILNSINMTTEKSVNVSEKITDIKNIIEETERGSHSLTEESNNLKIRAEKLTQNLNRFLDDIGS